MCNILFLCIMINQLLIFLQMENQSYKTGKRGIFVWREKHEMFLLREVIIHEPYFSKLIQRKEEERHGLQWCRSWKEALG